jgi:lipoyl(octanoyl) transferase
MKYIEFETKTGKENMQVDSDLLEVAIRSKLSTEIFRLYGWSPACVSLGRNQSEDFLDKEFLRQQKIDVVRRLTGGRALLHDKELTYSYICPIEGLTNGESVIGSYKEISQFLINGFKKLGIELEFGQKKPHTKFDYCMSISTGADLSFEGKKLIGSAQFRKDGYILQHGSILFDYDRDLIEKVFSEKIDEANLTSLKQISPNLGFNEVKEALISAIMVAQDRLKS